MTALADVQAKQLEQFVVNNQDLVALEAKLVEFNIFDALGMVRQEVRHSNFLAFLLAPQENHRLGDTFLKQLLQVVIVNNPDNGTAISLIDLDVWNLDEVEVRRERNNIDILLLDPVHKLVVVIENKIESTEHSDQLTRYLQIVNDQFQHWKTMGIYLTPDGAEPSNPNYSPLAYGAIADLLKGLEFTHYPGLRADVQTLIQHYGQMIRRHIMSNTDIAELCRRIYTKHRAALDLIYEHRPDRQAEIAAIIDKHLSGNSLFVKDNINKTYIHFLPRAWDSPSLKVADRWTASHRILLIEFLNQPDSLKLVIYIGPGPTSIRQTLLDLAFANQPPFKTPDRKLRKWNTIYERMILSPQADEFEGDEVQKEIEKHWSEFCTMDLPGLTAMLKTVELPWPL